MEKRNRTSPAEAGRHRRRGTPSGSPVARKRFGQHFLEPVWARKVVAAIAPHQGDVFVEIGPGPGAITRLLAPSVGVLLACEIDRDLAAALRDASLANVHVLEGDFLETTAPKIRSGVEFKEGTPGIRVAGNLPYNVGAPILFHLIDLARQGLPLIDATVMLQREVVDRLLASPSTRDYGVLSVLVAHRARVERLLDLPPGAFRPAPKVHSSVVRLLFHAPRPPARDESVLAAVTQAVFSRRRKTLANALLAYRGVTPPEVTRILEAAKLDGRRRPETLTIDEFVRLSDRLAAPA